MKKISLFIVAFLATMLMGLNAQIVKWDFSTMPGGSGNYGTSPLEPVSSDENLTVGDLTRNWSPSATGSGAQYAWGGNNFTATTFDDAVAANEFVTFSLTANDGYKLSVASIGEYNIRRSATGPSTGQWQYQIGAGSFVDIGASITWGTVTSAAGNPQAIVDVSAISELQNVAAGTTVTFRLVVWGATGTGGTFYFNDSSSAQAVLGLSVLGEVQVSNSLGQHTVDKGVVTGIFNLLGQSLKKSPEKGFYIVTYSNAKPEKILAK